MISGLDLGPWHNTWVYSPRSYVQFPFSVLSGPSVCTCTCVSGINLVSFYLGQVCVLARVFRGLIPYGNIPREYLSYIKKIKNNT